MYWFKKLWFNDFQASFVKSDKILFGCSTFLCDIRNKERERERERILQELKFQEYYAKYIYIFVWFIHEENESIEDWIFRLSTGLLKQTSIEFKNILRVCNSEIYNNELHHRLKVAIIWNRGTFSSWIMFSTLHELIQFPTELKNIH